MEIKSCVGPIEFVTLFQRALELLLHLGGQTAIPLGHIQIVLLLVKFEKEGIGLVGDLLTFLPLNIGNKYLITRQFSQ